MGNTINQTRVDNTLFVKITKTKELSPKEIGEFERRGLLGEETWKKYKTDLDNLLGFKKTIKGKPDEIQRFILDTNQIWINFYNSNLFHSVVLSRNDLCGCHNCGVIRTKKNTK
jgi:hypothetical protein